MNTTMRSIIIFILRWIAGSISALLLGTVLYVLEVLLASIDVLWKTTVGSWILNLEHFLWFLTFAGFPLGSAVGVILVNKKILKIASNRLAIAIGIAASVVGPVLILWGLPSLGINVMRMTPGFDRIGSNVLAFLLPLTCGLFCTIGYEITVAQTGLPKSE